jgi:hypothetical protein
MNKRDLFVVVADLDAENVIKTLLTDRKESLGISLTFLPYPPPNGDLLRYSGRDSGCCQDAVELMRPSQRTHRHALICFDRHGCGAENESREAIEARVENLLRINGWAEGEAAAIVIDPELEAWVWAPSREVATVLGWDGDINGMQKYLISSGLMNEGESKPSDPKKAMQKAVWVKRRRRLTATLFAELARSVGFQTCEDPSFNKLCKTLQQWFPR